MKTFFFILSIASLTFYSCHKCPIPITPTEKTLSLQPGPDSGNDTYVSFLSNDPTWANGNNNSGPQTSKELSAVAWSYNGGLSLTRTYISFNLAQIPANAEIISAKLSLYGLPSSVVSPQGNQGDNQIVIQEVTGNWNESTITWNTQPSTSGTNQIGMGPFTGTFNLDLADIDVTLLVKSMHSVTEKTGGFCIRLKDETVYKSLVFASSEYPDASKRPKLVIVYKS